MTVLMVGKAGVPSTAPLTAPSVAPHTSPSIALTVALSLLEGFLPYLDLSSNRLALMRELEANRKKFNWFDCCHLLFGDVIGVVNIDSYCGYCTMKT